MQSISKLGLIELVLLPRLIVNKTPLLERLDWVFVSQT
jgi:hypothetical protein